LGFGSRILQIPKSSNTQVNPLYRVAWHLHVLNHL
jgi:hypothetical protein